MLLVDLDRFESINDRFGHKVLQIFARIAQANLRQADLVGRLGGEEFVVVLADAGIDNAYLVADRLRNAFAVGAAVVDDQALHATASIGVSVIVDPAQDLAKLITLADQALYLAKSRGRNRVEVAPLEVSLGNEMPQYRAGAVGGLRRTTSRCRWPTSRPSFLRYPPPPTPPRHSLREWGEGSAPPAVLDPCNAFAVGAPALTALSVCAQLLLVNFDQNPIASASHPSALVPVPGPKP